MTLIQKRDKAQSYWNARSPAANPLRNLLPPSAPKPSLASPLDTKEYKTPVAKDQMDELIERFRALRAHVSDIDKRLQPRTQPAQKFYMADTRRPTPATGTNRTSMRYDRPRAAEGVCFICENPGHFAKDCDLVKKARLLKEGEFSSHLVMEVEEIFPGDAEDEYFNEESVYAVDKRKRDPVDTVPYTIKKRPGRPRVRIQDAEIERPTTPVSDPEFDKDLQEMLQRSTPDDAIMTEKPSDPRKKMVKKKTYDFNLWENMKDGTIQVPLTHLLQSSSIMRNQVRTGIASIKPGIEEVEVPVKSAMTV